MWTLEAHSGLQRSKSWPKLHKRSNPTKNLYTIVFWVVDSKSVVKIVIYNMAATKWRIFSEKIDKFI